MSFSVTPGDGRRRGLADVVDLRSRLDHAVALDEPARGHEGGLLHAPAQAVEDGGGQKEALVVEADAGTAPTHGLEAVGRGVEIALGVGDAVAFLDPGEALDIGEFDLTDDEPRPARERHGKRLVNVVARRAVAAEVVNILRARHQQDIDEALAELGYLERVAEALGFLRFSGHVVAPPAIRRGTRVRPPRPRHARPKGKPVQGRKGLPPTARD